MTVEYGKGRNNVWSNRRYTTGEHCIFQNKGWEILPDLTRFYQDDQLWPASQLSTWFHSSTKIYLGLNVQCPVSIYEMLTIKFEKSHPVSGGFVQYVIAVGVITYSWIKNLDSIFLNQIYLFVCASCWHCAPKKDFWQVLQTISEKNLCKRIPILQKNISHQLLQKNIFDQLFRIPISQSLFPYFANYH